MTASPDFGADPPGTNPPVTSYLVSIVTDDNVQDYQPVPADADGNLNYTKTGLQNGVTYYVRVRATNADGTSDDAGFTFAQATPNVAPLAPVQVSAIGEPSTEPSVAGSGSATVSFSPGADNGGSPPDYYNVTSSDGLGTAQCAGSPCTVPNLSNGTTYRFTVTATNGAGTSEPSAPSNAATPVGAPYAPQSIQRASANPVSVTVSFAPPVFSGAPVTRYQISSDNGKNWREVAVRKSGSRLLATAPYLRSGLRYAVRVRAVNIVRSIARAGVPSSAVTVLTGPSVVVGQPSVRVGTAAARVQWPASREPDVIGYTVVSSRGAVCTTGTRLETSCIVGARAGLPTTFRVYARSAAGSSYPSKPTRAVLAAMPAVSRSTPGVPGGFSTKPKSVRSGRVSTFVAPGYLPGSTVRMVVYGQQRHVMTATVANSRGLAGVTMTVPKDAARTLTFVIFGVTPYASPKAVGASIRRT